MKLTKERQKSRQRVPPSCSLTPKIYQRILRFNEILPKIRDKEQTAWAEVAYPCGYSDQSHFIKEFSHFSGFNPQEFIGLEYNRGESPKIEKVSN